VNRRMLHRRRSRVEIARSLHETFRISISGPRSLQGPLAFPLASYPFVPFIQRPFVSWRLSALRRSPILPSLSLSRRIYPPSCLSCANRGATLRYFAGFILGNIWWLACGQRELALPGNLRRQGGGSRTRLGPFTRV